MAPASARRRTDPPLARPGTGPAPLRPNPALARPGTGPVPHRPDPALARSGTGPTPGTGPTSGHWAARALRRSRTDATRTAQAPHGAPTVPMAVASGPPWVGRLRWVTESLRP